MQKEFIVVSVAWFLSMPCIAQEQPEKTAEIPSVQQPAEYPELHVPNFQPSFTTIQPSYIYGATTSPFSDAGSSVMPQFDFRSTISNPHPNLLGSVSATSLPGLMGVESGLVGWRLDAGNVSFTPSLSINKYGYFGGMQRSLGVGGSLTWQIGESPFRLTLFGQYQSSVWTPNPAVLSNMATSRYGGYMTWANERISFNLGAQRTYNPITRRWETIPIVEPIIKIGSVPLGFDFGGLVYDLLRDVIPSNRPSAPPIPTTPPTPRLKKH